MVDDRDPRGGVGRASPGAPTQPGDQALDATAPGATATANQDTVVPLRPTPVPLSLPPPGYQLGALIGRGGMGEVLAAHDQRIGREVAIKRMRTALPSGEQLGRFLREARIQARLDHPAIVPVHELGTDEAGRPFFTMKRVSGKTLAQRMAEGASLQALLRAFIDVCLAIDLAHSRAVIHRDLKPANIMLGDYGEVYVLDWGVARVLTERNEVARDIDTLDEGTQEGAILGTPGYMAPEQIRAEPATPAVDIYALGAILFEILTGESLHPRGQEALASTLTMPQEAPAHRRPDRVIPPELDAICHEALASDSKLRPSARVLADRVQAYLDGDRDLERRRALAEQHLARARDGRDRGGAEGRATAIREAGLALALSPTSVEAGTLLTSLLVEPPDPIPAELQAALDAEELKVAKQRSRAGTRALFLIFSVWPLFPFMGVKSWGWLVAIYVVLTGLLIQTLVASRRGTYNLAFGLGAGFVLAVLWTRLAGPFLLTPVLVSGVLATLTTKSWLHTRRWAIVAYAAATVLVPVGLERIG
ncbi:MAG TPA: serine/threonine-protein kinase, partial [Kofleriaceae bacterium]|nr:serine/threonine-protein kinase [Kofleriaceae bacterium]